MALPIFQHEVRREGLKFSETIVYFGSLVVAIGFSFGFSFFKTKL